MSLDPRTWIAIAALSIVMALPPTASLALAQSSSRSMEPFGSFSELSRYLKRVVDEQNRWTQEGIEAAAIARRSEPLSCKPPERTAGGTLRDFRRVANTSGTPRRAVVRGRVTDIKGTGLVGAVVSASGIGIATSSHANGLYELVIPAESLMTRRPVKLRGSHADFREFVYTVELGEGDSATVDLRLCLNWFPAVTVMTGMLPLSYRNDRSDNIAWTDPQMSERVKLHGDHLVILQRGRLFTVSIRDHGLRGVSVVNVFPPGMEPDSTSYSDLFVSGDKVVVLGFNSRYAVSELSTFLIDKEGGLRYLATYQMLQDQGVFFPKYVAKMVGTKLVIYTPLVLPDDISRIRKALPAFRKWHKNATDSEFRSIAEPQRVYRPARPLMPYDRATLHTLTSCDLAPHELTCTAKVIIAPAEFEFYSSRSAVYVWIGDSGNGPTGDEGNTLYRFPLNDTAPSSRIFVNPAGTPFSFTEDDKGYLHVLMYPIWPTGPMPPGTTSYDVGLLQIPVSSFRRDGNRSHAPLYKPLPPAGGGRSAFGFVGEFILYSNAVDASDPNGTESVLNVMPLSGAAGATIPVAHPIFLIKGLDSEAVAIGPLGNALHFSIVSLPGSLHSSKHFAFTDSTDIDFVRYRVIYRRAGPDSGLLAAPVHNRNRSKPNEGYYNAPSILFLSKTKSGLSFAGRIGAHEPAVMDDDCKGTCADWFDDASAFFISDRIFALLRYELVEGRYEDGHIREIGRVSFAPRGVGSNTRNDSKFEATDFRSGRWFKGNTHTHTLESDGDSPPDRANPGRGWVVVRADRLEAEAIMTALEAGRFYASSSVALDSISVGSDEMTIHITQKGNFKYTTEFVGKAGEVLKRTGANPATYKLSGGESYVRARIIDSTGYMAWVQPVFGEGR